VRRPYLGELRASDRSPEGDADDFVGILTKNILDKLALIGCGPGLANFQSSLRDSFCNW
jgi:hypothetical protein